MRIPFLILTFLSLNAMAGYTEVVPIQEIEIMPDLTTANDVVLRGDYYYPNGCYISKRSMDREGTYGEVITLKHEVTVRDGMCTMAIVYDQSKFHLEDYTEGYYELVDAYDKKVLGELYVDENGKHRLIQID